MIRSIFYLLILGLTSCTEYQYVTVSSNNNKGNLGSPIHETDSLTIRYVFDGQNGPIRISIENKLDVPLYVNWKESAIIVGNLARSYWIDSSSINASAISDQFRFDQGEFITPSSVAMNDGFKFNSRSETRISGEIVKGDPVEFIPPRSFKASNHFQLRKEKFLLINDESLNVKRVPTTNGMVKVRQYAFERENTPLSFRSYLTFSTDANFNSRWAHETEFWVSEIIETPTSPGTFYSGRVRDGSFYVAILE